MSDVNTTTASPARDPFGPVNPMPTFQEPSDYQIGQHAVYHHFDGKDYEAVICEVWRPGSDVANRWVVHLDVGDLGVLRNVTQASREDTQPEGTFSLKPQPAAGLEDDALVHNQKAGTVLPTRADENPRPQQVEREETGPRGGKHTRVVNPGDEPLKPEDFEWSDAPLETPQPDQKANEFEEIRDDQWHMEHDAENPGDEGLDTPANYVTDDPDADPRPEAERKVGTTQASDDAHLEEDKPKRSKSSTKGDSTK